MFTEHDSLFFDFFVARLTEAGKEAVAFRSEDGCGRALFGDAAIGEFEDFGV